MAAKMRLHMQILVQASPGQRPEEQEEEEEERMITSQLMEED